VPGEISGPVSGQIFGHNQSIFTLSYKATTFGIPLYWNRREKIRYIPPNRLVISSKSRTSTS
jgi:hypothetical protein